MSFSLFCDYFIHILLNNVSFIGGGTSCCSAVPQSSSIRPGKQYSICWINEGKKKLMCLYTQKLFLVGMGASISLIACHMRPVWGKDTESNGVSALQSEVASVREWLDWAGWDSIVSSSEFISKHNAEELFKNPWEYNFFKVKKVPSEFSDLNIFVLHSVHLIMSLFWGTQQH